MLPSFRFSIFAFAAAIAGCAPSAVTDEEVVPVYESPCAVYEVAGSAEGGTAQTTSGDGACGTADENGSFIDAWSALPCMDVCGALNTSEPHSLLACGPVHPAISGDNAGFVVVDCTFDAENYK
jgi:hypothetical protein